MGALLDNVGCAGAVCCVELSLIDFVAVSRGEISVLLVFDSSGSGTTKGSLTVTGVMPTEPRVNEKPVGAEVEGAGFIIFPVTVVPVTPNEKPPVPTPVIAGTEDIPFVSTGVCPSRIVSQATHLVALASF